MRIQIKSKVSLILVVMAAASLVSMLATLNIDRIINHDLYGYGLQFNTNWADQYWTMTAIVFSMGWLIIAISIAYELNLVAHRLHRHPEAEAPAVHEELVQPETPRIEAKPIEKPEEEEVEETVEEEVKTTGLAVKTDDVPPEPQLILEETPKTAQATVTRQKTDNKPTNED